MSRTNQSSSLLLVLILLVTFPFWIAAAAVVFGVAAGLIGAVVGIIAGIFGAIIGLIALPFKLVFGWHDWSWHFPHGNFNGYVFLAFAIIALLIFQKRKR